MTRLSIPVAARALLTGAALAFAVPAVAQDYYPMPPAPDYAPDEEIIVEGRYDRVPEDARSLSQAVSYADLDLRYSEDRRELRRRVSLTSRFLCDQLGESDVATPIVPSCRDAATRDALRRIGRIEAHWVPRDTAWIAPPHWDAPYPREWDRR